MRFVQKEPLKHRTRDFRDEIKESPIIFAQRLATSFQGSLWSLNTQRTLTELNSFSNQLFSLTRANLVKVELTSELLKTISVTSISLQTPVTFGFPVYRKCPISCKLMIYYTLLWYHLIYYNYCYDTYKFMAIYSKSCVNTAKYADFHYYYSAWFRDEYMRYLLCVVLHLCSLFRHKYTTQFTYF